MNVKNNKKIKIIIAISTVVIVLVGGIITTTCVAEASVFDWKIFSILKNLSNKKNNNNNSNKNNNNNNYQNNNGNKNNNNSNKNNNNNGKNNTNANSNVNVSNNANWMSKVQDNMNLSDITIPGVHDAGTCKVQLSYFSQCQDKSIKDLLDCGFRYLDIRVGVDNNKLRFYHGSTSCLQPNGSGNLYLDSVLNDCYSFLDKNPSETILFAVKQENGSGGVADFQNVLNSYIQSNANKWLLTDFVPTLGSARGKMVLFRRHSDEARLGRMAGIPTIWRDQGDKSNSSLSYEDNQNEGKSLMVQDRYKYSADSKWNAFDSTITASVGRSGCMKINFLSTTGSGLLGSPKSYADSLNKSLLKKTLKGNKLGWLIVDFGNSDIASHIYSANF